MSFRPAYVYKVKSGIVLSSHSPSGSVTVNSGESLLLLYDAQAMARYGTATRIQVVNTYSRVPVCDKYVVHYDNRVSTNLPTVGQTYTYDSSIYTAYGGYYSNSGYSYDGAGSNVYSRFGYVAITLGASAVDANGRMTTDQTFTISGFELNFTAGSTYPFTASSNFSGGYKNQSRAFTISLSATQYNNSISQYSIAGGTFYYKKSSASSYSSITFSGSSVTVPAGTLETASTYNIYFTARANTGETADCGTANISTTDAAAVVTAVSPSNEVTHGSATFVWNYTNSYGEAQHAYDLQISTDNANWTTIRSHIVTSSTSYTYSGLNTSSTIYWRVRGYNQSDQAGAWSASKSFVNRVPPATPTIVNISIAGRVTVQWSATNQKAYRLQILQNASVVYDSGDVYGTATSARVQQYLSNGGYVARVRIIDQYGEESSWGTKNFTQTAELDPLEYSAAYDPMLNGVLIQITSTGFTRYYIERNGMLIAKINTPEYLDLYASGPTTYRLIAVNGDDQFSQAEFTLNIRIQSSRLVTLDGTILEVNERWDNFNNTSQTESAKVSAYEFFGASAPTHVFAKMRTKRITQAFYDPERISIGLLGQVAWYGDIYGNADYVAIISRSRSDSWIGDETVLEMELTSWSAGVDYD